MVINGNFYIILISDNLRSCSLFLKILSRSLNIQRWFFLHDEDENWNDKSEGNFQKSLFTQRSSEKIRK